MSKSLFRPEVESLTPYQPGKPVEDVQRELGLERVVKLASNEGPFPPFPSAIAAMSAELELNRYPDGVLPVIDQAYFEYVDRPEYPDVVAEHFVRGSRVVVLRTFSKIFGLAGLRVGYAVGPRNVCEGMAKIRRPFDVTTTAQAAALASLDDGTELARRRQLNARGLVELTRILMKYGLAPVPGAVGNFVFVDLEEDAASLFERLLREGVIVRPLAGFGAPTAVRISVGAPDELEFLDAALGRIYS